MSLIKIDDKNVWDKEVTRAQLEVQAHVMHLDFHVMHMTRADVVWAMSNYMGWIHHLNIFTNTTLLLLMLIVHMFY